MDIIKQIAIKKGFHPQHLDKLIEKEQKSRKKNMNELRFSNFDYVPKLYGKPR